MTIKGVAILRAALIGAAVSWLGLANAFAQQSAIHEFPFPDQIFSGGDADRYESQRTITKRDISSSSAAMSRSTRRFYPMAATF